MQPRFNAQLHRIIQREAVSLPSFAAKQMSRALRGCFFRVPRFLYISMTAFFRGASSFLTMMDGRPTKQATHWQERSASPFRYWNMHDSA